MTVSFADTFHLYGTEIFCVTGKVRAYLRHKTMATVGAVAIERQVLAVMAASTTALPALAARDRAFGQTQRGKAVDHQLKLPANHPLAGELQASLQALVEAIDRALAG